VCGTNWQTVQGFTTNGGPQTLEYLNGTATIASPSVVLNVNCGLPMATAYTISYDATPTTLRLHIGQGGTPAATRVDTFIRQ
jgi:methionine synthase I (cobalamin-dependent)